RQVEALDRPERDGQPRRLAERLRVIAVDFRTAQLRNERPALRGGYGGGGHGRKMDAVRQPRFRPRSGWAGSDGPARGPAATRRGNPDARWKRAPRPARAG